MASSLSLHVVHVYFYTSSDLLAATPPKNIPLATTLATKKPWNAIRFGYIRQQLTVEILTTSPKLKNLTGAWVAMQSARKLVVSPTVKL